MNRNKHIRIVISNDGTVSVDAVNFRGSGCKAATAEITAALGGQVEQEREKPENVSGTRDIVTQAPSGFAVIRGAQ